MKTTCRPVAMILGLMFSLLAGGGLLFAETEYSRDVAPLFRKYCVGCHNPRDAEGGLVLTTFAEAKKGGENGPVWVAGKPEESTLLAVLSGSEPSMPPEGNPSPTAEEVAQIRAWLIAGALGPTSAQEPAWVVAPVIKPTVPVRDAISSVAFSPNGELIALGKFGQTTLIDGGERMIRRELTGLLGQTNAVAFSKDGKFLFTAGGDAGRIGEIKQWNVESGELTKTYSGHNDAVYSLAVSPDGSKLATGSYDSSIQVWNTSNGERVVSLPGHNGGVFSLAFHANGKWLVSASGDRTIKLWDVATGKRLDTFAQPLKEMYGAQFTSRGDAVLGAGGDSRVRMWRLGPEALEGSNKQVYSKFCHQAPIVAMAVSANDEYVITAAEDRSLRISNVRDASEVAVLGAQSDLAAAIAVSADSSRFVVGRLDGSFDVYSLPLGQLVPPRPTLTALSLPGIRIGESRSMTLKGTHFSADSKVLVSHPELVVDQKVVESAESMQVVLEVKATATRGDVELWVENEGQASAKLKLYVDDLPQTVIDETIPATSITESTTLWGVLETPGDTDSFRVTCKAGETLIGDAMSLEEDKNLTLSLYGPAGESLAIAQDFGVDRNPLLAYPIEKSGEYLLRVSEHTFKGSPTLRYRLNVGPLPFAVAISPLAAPANKESSVRLLGYNLTKDAVVSVPAASAGAEVELAMSNSSIRQRAPHKVLVDSWGSAAETEPNNDSASATPLQAPGAGDGVLSDRLNRPDVDYFRFRSEAGQAWIVEVLGARRGSPIDSIVEVLNEKGEPLPKIVMQAVRDSVTTFRPSFSGQTGFRVTNWEEMFVDQYLYLNGEVCRIFRQPQGPDSDTLFYDANGSRRGYWDTTPIQHPLEEAVYVVEPHPPGKKPLNNGLPAFTIYHTNDDDTYRRYGSDSRLSFTAPYAGEFLVKVRDVRGFSGDRFAYRLIVRPQSPDFAPSVESVGAPLPIGNGKKFVVRVDRMDDFEGEVRFDFDSTPDGVEISSPLVIQEGHVRASGVLFAKPNAQPGSFVLKGTATGMIRGKPVVKDVAFGSVEIVNQAPSLVVTLEPRELDIRPGETITAQLKIERNGFNDRVSFDVSNLPHGIIVDNIGLSGVLIPPDQNERTIYITAEPWVPAASRTFQATASIGGEPTSLAATLHVKRDGDLASQ